MDVKDESYAVSKLDGTANFKLWKFHVMAVLRGKDLETVVDGKYAKPAETAATKDQNEWRQKDGKATAILFGSLAAEQKLLVIACKSAKEIMDKLESIHEKKSDVRIMMLYEQYFSLKMRDDESIASYVARTTQLAAEIEDQEENEKLSDNIKMCRIVSGLTDKFNNFRTVWYNVKESRNLDTLMAKLQLEEDSIGRAKESTSEAAFVASNVKLKKKKLSKAERKKNSTCHVCGQKGHWKSDCKNRDGEKGEKSNAVAFSAIGDVISDEYKNVWIADSGATKHITSRREWFAEYHDEDNGRYVEIANDEKLYVKGFGTIEIEAWIDGTWHQRRLENVLHVPKAKMNLFAFGQLTEKGLNVVFHEKTFNVVDTKGGNVLAVGVKDMKCLFRMIFRQKGCEFGNACSGDSTIASLQQWHRRLGHINVATVKSMYKKQLVDGIDFSNEKNFFCEECPLGKMHRVSHPSTEPRAVKKGECVHMDLCGPMEQNGIGNVRYFLLLKDEATNFRFIYNIGQKSEVVEKLAEFLSFIENAMQTTIKRVRCDNAKEFFNKEVGKLLSARGVSYEKIASYTPEQNGFIERENRTVQESARTMLVACGLNKSLWPEAVKTAVYFLNRSPSSKHPDTTPYQQWFGKKPNLSHVKVFGTVGFAHVPINRKKWDPKAIRVHLVGYEATSKNYRLFDPKSNKVFVSCDVKFNESCVESEYLVTMSDDDDEKDDGNARDASQQVSVDVHSAGKTFDSIEVLAEDDKHDVLPTITKEKKKMKRRDSLREHPTKTKFYDAEKGCSAFVMEPQTYDEAVKSSESAKWREAIEDELKSLNENGTWEIVKKPARCNVIGSKWVFKIKNPTGEEPKFKARLVAKGFSQKSGIDYSETFSPVVRYDSVRTVLSLAAIHNMEITQFDVKTAFLNGNLAEDIYMRMPEGVQCEDGYVCHLRKSLYGLKQASRAWNSKFVEFMKGCNMAQSHADACVFRGTIMNEKVILLLYVDDGLVVSSSQKAIDILVEKLSEAFQITIGNANYYCGMEIGRDRERKTITIGQESYISRIIEKFNMVESKSISTPSDVGVILTKSNERDDIDYPYRQAVGSLLYAATVSRPDIAQAVGDVSRYLENPNRAHINALKRILRYLNGTKSMGITYGSSSSNDRVLAGYTDADFARDVDTRRSTTGYAFVLGGGVITWRSQRQRTVALSTAEAEYMAACEGAKEAFWLRQLLDDMGFDQNSATKLFVDNQSTIRMIRNPEFHHRTKHIDVRVHFIRELVEDEVIDLEYCPSENQLADVFTKPLVTQKFNRNIQCLGIAWKEEKTTQK